MRSTLFNLTIGGFGILVFTSLSIAQCAECVPDPDCSSADGFPTICPDQLIAGESGVYYEEVITFYLPAQITDPGTSITATLVSLTVNSVSGLPFGMTYSFDDEDGVYFPSQGQTTGCATLCGTPLLPGVYIVSISVTAILSAFNSTFEQNETFSLPLEILEGEGGTESFSMSQQASCGPATVILQATLAGVYPQITTYEWNFGNEEQASTGGPHAINYTENGVYEVSLNTVISNLVLSGLVLSSLAPGWGGDIDESFGLGQPDPFFQLKDADGVIVFTSSTLDNTQTGSWSGLNVVLSNPPYTMDFWDEDLFTANDFLGTASVTLQVGSSAYSTGTGTSGMLTISSVQVNNITSTTQVNIFPEPDAGFTVVGGLFTCQEADAQQYVWYRNDVPLAATSCVLQTDESGIYQLEVTNDYGCTSVSEPYLYCAEVTPVYNAVTEVISVPAGYLNYQWYFNGLPLDGENTHVLNYPSSGNYGVVLSTSYGCTIQSTVITVTVGVDKLDTALVRLFPNPVSEVLYVSLPYGESGQITLLDSVGRIVHQSVHSESEIKIDISSHAAGWYVLRLESDIRTVHCRILVCP